MFVSSVFLKYAYLFFALNFKKKIVGLISINKKSKSARGLEMNRQSLLRLDIDWLLVFRSLAHLEN